MKKMTRGNRQKFPDDTSHVKMEEVVSDRKDDKNEKYNEGKDVELHDDPSHVETEEDVNDINDDKNEIYDKGKRQNSQMTLPLMRWSKV